MASYDVPTLERTIDGRRSMRSVADALEALSGAQGLSAGSFIEIRTSRLPARISIGPSIVLVVCHATRLWKNKGLAGGPDWIRTRGPVRENLPLNSRENFPVHS